MKKRRKERTWEQIAPSNVKVALATTTCNLGDKILRVRVFSVEAFRKGVREATITEAHRTPQMSCISAKGVPEHRGR